MKNQNALPSEAQHDILEPSSHHGMTARKDTHAPAVKSRIIPVDTIQHGFLSFTITTSAMNRQILAASRKRRYLLIQNTGTVTVFLGFNTVPDVNGNGAIEVPPGSQVSFENGIVPNGTINAISNAAGKLAILEGSRP